MSTMARMPLALVRNINTLQKATRMRPGPQYACSSSIAWGTVLKTIQQSEMDFAALMFTSKRARPTEKVTMLSSTMMMAGRKVRREKLEELPPLSVVLNSIVWPSICLMGVKKEALR